MKTRKSVLSFIKENLTVTKNQLEDFVQSTGTNKNRVYVSDQLRKNLKTSLIKNYVDYSNGHYFLNCNGHLELSRLESK